MKYCPKCKTIKNKDEFGKAKGRYDGLRGWCKKCTNLATSEWQKLNPEKRRAKGKRFYDRHREEILPVSRIRTKEWYQKNTERALLNSKNWAINNRSKVNQSNKKWKQDHAEEVIESNKKYREEHKEERYEYNIQWRCDNPDKARALGRKHTKKRLQTPKGRLCSNVSRGIRTSLGKAGKKGKHWEELVDFTIDQLKNHLEKLFNPGMTWDNYGTVWEIDHKIPIAVFNFETPEHIDFKLCWNIKNLQPLEVKNNRSKGAKIDKPFQPSLQLATGGN